MKPIKMINKTNLPDVLIKLRFSKTSENKYEKHFSYFDCELIADFNGEKLLYPISKGLIVNDEITANFDKNENFVVFECVRRLLEKGYSPNTIELEPRWQLGHEEKGGKADILVKDKNGNPLLIIECKTTG